MTVDSNRTRLLVERMYWAHGYAVKDIVDRLRLSEKLVEAILARDYVETELWNEDTGTYTKIRTKRTRSERPQLIIPEATPVSRTKEQLIREQLERIAQSVETPLRRLTEESKKNDISRQTQSY
jgi:hypothetical protein